MDWIPVGKLARTHGLKGELKFYPHDPEGFGFADGQPVQLAGTKKKLKVQPLCKIGVHDKWYHIQGA